MEKTSAGKKVLEVPFDKSLLVNTCLPEFHYSDSYEIVIYTAKQFSTDYALNQFLNLFPKVIFTRPVPDKFNLKDKVSIWEIVERNEKEIVLKSRFKILSFCNSFFMQNHVNGINIKVSTIVFYKSITGRAYFSLVLPFHKLLVKRYLKNLASLLQ